MDMDINNYYMHVQCLIRLIYIEGVEYVESKVCGTCLSFFDFVLFAKFSDYAICTSMC